MDTTLYLFTQIGFVSITVIFFGLLLKTLKRGLSKSTITTHRQNKIFKNVIIALVLWMVILSGLSFIEFFSDFSAFPPRFIIIVLVPMIALVWSLLFSKITKQLLAHIPPQRFISLQVFRVFVEFLLWLLFIQNLLPIQMTFEGRNFDIIAGITAPLVAYLAYTKNILPRNMVIIWNIICLGLLLNIVLTAIFSMPTSFRYFINEPSSSIVTQFPIIWLPGFLVPLAYGLHFLSIRQLLNQKN